MTVISDLITVIIVVSIPIVAWWAIVHKWRGDDR